MPRPAATATGKTTEFREDLNSFRRKDPERFKQEISRVKQIYIEQGTMAKTAIVLKIGKRTLERAMRDIPELRKAIDEARIW